MSGSWEPFLPSLCLNFLEVYTDASVVLSICKWSIKYSVTTAMWENERIFNLPLWFTLQVKCDYAPTPQSLSQMLLKCSALTSYRVQLERKWLYRLSFRNQWGPLPQRRGIKMRAWAGQGSREGALKISALMQNGIPNCGMYHSMKDVKQRVSGAALLSHAQGKVSAREGTWDWCR